MALRGAERSSPISPKYDPGPAFGSRFRSLRDGRLARADHVETVRRVALVTSGIPGGNVSQRRARAARRGSWSPIPRTVGAPAARPVACIVGPKSGAWIESASSRSKVALVDLEDLALVDGPNRRRPWRRLQQPHLPERFAAFHHAQDLHVHRCPDPPPRRRTARAHDVERRRAGRPDGRRAGPRADPPERDAAGEVVQRLDRQVVERGQLVDRARRPRSATSIRHGTRARERSHEPGRDGAHGPAGSAHGSRARPRTRRAARGATSSRSHRSTATTSGHRRCASRRSTPCRSEKIVNDDPDHGVEPEADLLLGEPLARPQLVPQVVLEELQATAGEGPAPGSGR